MIYDAMWPGGPVFIRDDAAFRPGTDAVLLASFAVAGLGNRAGGRILRGCDLGCGTGVVALLMAWENTRLHIDGVEIQDEWAGLSRENARLSGLGDRVNVITGDLRCHREFLEAGAYDLVVSNPPYYAAGSGKSAPSAARATAREERTCTLSDIIEAARYLTRWGGRFCLVHKPERLPEVLSALSSVGLEPKRLRFVQNKPESAPSLFLLECRRGARPALTIEPPLILTDESGGESAEIKRVYHRI